MSYLNPLVRTVYHAGDAARPGTWRGRFQNVYERTRKYRQIRLQNLRKVRYAVYRFDERGQPATHFTVAFYGLEQARFPSNFFIRREEEVIDMSITVTGRKMPVTDALRMYAEEKIGQFHEGHGH